MRTYERNGVHVDQCQGCRGIFLDRGELEALIDREAEFFSRQQQAAPAPRYDSHKDDFRYKDDYRYKKKKRHSFLSELFDD